MQRLSPALTVRALCAIGVAAACMLPAEAAAGQTHASAGSHAQGGGPGHARDLPVGYGFTAGFATTAPAPGSPPPGANDFSCRPSAAHPYPVVLVHGTFENMNDNWQALSPLLANHGYCVFALNYGGDSPSDPIQGTRDIPASARQLSAFAARVLAATGASKIDIIGHSQGGMMPRYYMKFLGGAAKVHDLIGLSPSNHGTTIDGLTTLAKTLHASGAVNDVFGVDCVSCEQQEVGSSFIRKLNAGGDTVAGVRYTVIETSYDEVVTPYTSAFLSGPRVRNILVQNQCPLDTSDHVETAYDPVALADVLNALDPAHPVPVPCTTVLSGAGPVGPAPGE